MVWQSLGSVIPESVLWLPFPGNAGDGTVFRLQFISGGNIENVFSSLWFRRIWQAGTSTSFREKEVEPVQKLYPQPHSLILWLPIPPALSVAGISPVGYEVRKNLWSRKGNYSEPNWYVNLDVFV